MESMDEQLRDAHGRLEEWDFILIKMFDVKGAFRIWARSKGCNHDRPRFGESGWRVEQEGKRVLRHIR